MGKKSFIATLLALAGTIVMTSFADDATNKPAAATTNAPVKTGTNSSGTNSVENIRRGGIVKQAAVASTNATFGKIAATDAAYKSALDAHALEDALKMVEKDGGFKGTVAKVYEPRGLAIVEFDENYRNALTAIVHGTNFDKFPALTNLIGKSVLVTGKFVKYRDAAQIILDTPDQIKVVEPAK